MAGAVFQRCINPQCAATFDVAQVLMACPRCGSLLDVCYDWAKLKPPRDFSTFERRWATKGSDLSGRLDFSGVWRFRELLPFYRAESDIVTVGEGRTVLQNATLLASELGMKPGSLFLQYEGLNPSGSFKDNGMAAAFTHARMVGANKVACASTGNTSASLAMFASLAQMQGIVFIGSGRIALGKLSQALDYGAKTLQIRGDFDACLNRLQQVAQQVPGLGIYVMNSLNPFRLEGQKSIMYRILEARDWDPPDWVIVPGGNLGNCSAFGKAFAELRELGLINRIPRLAVINATGANTLYELFTRRNVRWNGGRVDASAVDGFYREAAAKGVRAHTVASAIEIGRPVNLFKALRALDVMQGVVRQVSDEEILENRALVGRFGFGCEPASAASVAGLRLLLEEKIIGRDQSVVCILTGHQLKDPNAAVMYHTGIDLKSAQSAALPSAAPLGRLSNPPIVVDDDLDSIVRALGGSAAEASAAATSAAAAVAEGARPARVPAATAVKEP
jgi:threonine synthase